MVHVNTVGLEDVIAEFQAEADQVQAACRRAVNRTLKWIWTRARRDISARVGVAQKMLMKRFQITPAKTMASGVVGGSAWIGLNPIRVTQKLFGTLTKTPTGARAGRLNFPGAFVFLTPKKGEPGIYKRRGKARTPIDLVSIETDGPETRDLIDKITAEASEQLVDTLRAELNYQVNVK
jgi:hypothetical protein